MPALPPSNYSAFLKRRPREAEEAVSQLNRSSAIPTAPVSTPGSASAGAIPLPQDLSPAVVRAAGEALGVPFGEMGPNAPELAPGAVAAAAEAVGLRPEDVLARINGGQEQVPQRPQGMAGFLDPQQYAELGKGILPGAVQFGGTAMRGVGAIQAGGEQKMYEDQLRTMELIDTVGFNGFVDTLQKEAEGRGQRLDPAMIDAADPFGYRAMAPEEREAFKAEFGTRHAPSQVQETGIFQAGEAVSEYGENMLPAASGYEDSTGRALGEGLGSLLSGVVANVVGGPLGSGAFFAAGGSGESVDRAVEAGASEEEIIQAANMGLIPGLTDSVPVEVLMGRIPVAGKFLKIPANMLGKAIRGAGRIGQQAFIEGIQEGGQEFIQNVIEREVYNPDQDLGENIIPSAGLGGGVGAIAEFSGQIIRNIGGRRRAGAARQAQDVADKLAGLPGETTVELDGQTAKTPPQQQATISDPPGPGFELLVDDQGQPTGWGNPSTGEEVPLGGQAAVAPPEGQEPAISTPPAADVSRETTGDGTRAAPVVEPRSEEDLDIARNQVDVQPTDGKKEAGNYKKGHVKYQGLDITIENPIGSERSGTGPDGKSWSVEMPADYGYIKRTEGADGDQVDIYLGPDMESDRVFVVDQYNLKPKEGESGFDEHKVMLGFSNTQDAIDVYSAAFSDGRGRERIGGITSLSIDEFKKEMQAGKFDKPRSERFTTNPGELSTEHESEVSALEAAGTQGAAAKIAQPEEDAASSDEYDAARKEFQAAYDAFKDLEAPPPETDVDHPYYEAKRRYDVARAAFDELDEDGKRTSWKTYEGDYDYELENGLDASSNDTLRHYAKGLGIETGTRGREEIISDLRSKGATAAQGGAIIYIPAKREDVADRLSFAQGRDLLSEKQQGELRDFLRRKSDVLSSSRLAEGFTWELKNPSGNGSVSFTSYGNSIYISAMRDPDDNSMGYGGSTIPKSKLRRVLSEIYRAYPPDGAPPSGGDLTADQAREALKTNIDPATGKRPKGNKALREFRARMQAIVDGEKKTPPTITEELIDAGQKSVEQFRSRISNVKYTEDGISFDLDGKPMVGRLEGRNRDLVLGSSEEADRAIAARVYLDGHAEAVKDKKPEQKPEQKPEPPKEKSETEQRRERVAKMSDVGEVMAGKRASIENRFGKDDDRKALDSVLEETRAVLRIADVLGPNATSGAHVYADRIRRNLNSFLEVKGRQLGGGRKRWQDAFSKEVEAKWRKDPDDIRKDAAEYIAVIDTLKDYLAGAENVQQIHDALRKIAGYKPGEVTQDEGDRNPLEKDILAYSKRSFRFAFSLRLPEPEKWSISDDSKMATKKTPLRRKSRSIDEIERTDLPDYRGGKDVSAEDFRQKFGFRGVEFGNWVTGGERQTHVNLAYDSLMDFAEVLGIPPKAVSLGGRLGLAFGSRGRGRHAAHFEPTNDVINLTRTSGDGSVAHEWGHAFDYLLRKLPKSKGLLNSVNVTLNSKYDIDKAISKLDSFLRGNLTYTNSRKAGRIENARKFLKYHADNPSHTRFKLAGLALDKGRGDYWGKSEELWARSFESWVFDELEKDGHSSPYLVNEWVAEGHVTKDAGYRGTPYPDGDERQTFAKMWREVFKSVKFNDDGTIVDQGYDAIDIGITTRDDVRNALEEIDLQERLAEIEAEKNLPPAVNVRSDENEDAADEDVVDDDVSDEAAPEEAEQEPAEETGDQKLARMIEKYLDDGGAPMGQNPFIRMANEAYGGTAGSGAYGPRRAYDAMETGANLHFNGKRAERYDPTGNTLRPDDALMMIRKVANTLPIQSRRTADTDAFQQFSTPPDYGFAVNWAANLTPNDVVLEPSAGNGNIAIFAKNAGAGVIVNEIGEGRRKNLETLGFARVFGEDAEQINNILPDDIRPTVVLMNPPFSAAGARGGVKDSNITGRHIDQALALLQPGGRLVAIVGGNFVEGNSRNRPYFEKWKKNNQLRASVEVGGEVYRRYGTTYPTRVLVLDKIAPTGEATVTGSVESTDALIDLLKGVRDARQPAPARADRGEQFAAEPEGQGVSGGTGPNRPVRSSTGESGTARPGGGAGSGGRDVDVSRPAGGGGTENGDEVSVPGGRDRPSSGTERGQPSDAEPSGQPNERDGAGVSPAAEGVGVNYSDEEAEQGKELGGGVYQVYKPQRLKIPGAKSHPAELVQSAAMASVLPPKPTYQPKLPERVIKDGLLSDAQLEAVVYAGQSHEKMLGDETTRRGFFIGDGTGVGKGREASGIILDNFQNGRKRAIWVSEKWPLLNDAIRDWTGLGQDKAAFIDGKKIKATGSIPDTDGIFFTTYDTIKQKSKREGQKSRLEQITDWLPADFDGVIVFDEAHNMANLGGQKGARGKKLASQKAISGLELQKAFPNARVVYMSATGATEVSNLSYAERLGLWGQGTAFANVTEFLTEIETGGIAAMEMIARDLKQLGRYIARGLSFDGVEYDRLEHTLTEDQRMMYDRLAEAWQSVLQNIDEVLELTDANKNAMAKSAALSQFWSSHQRFFNQVLTSMQMPTVLKQLQKDVKGEFAPVLQLVNTNEAATDRALATLGEDDSLEDLDITPRDQLIQFIQTSFPTQQFETYIDENGNERSRPVLDSLGNPVRNKEAERMRDALIDDLNDIAVPDGPLDMILNEFGANKVAEVTGRTQRVILRDGKRVRERRPGSANTSEADAFMGGKKDMLVFSMAGGTGRSYHADITAKNKRRRRHYLLQPGWSAAPAVQGFGRSHRSNQASKPFYYLVTTDVVGQKRFISSVARRLDQLGALTKGQRQTGGQGLFSQKDNLESQYAKDAIERLIKGVYENAEDLREYGLTMDVFTKGMGLTKLVDPRSGGLNTGEVPDVPRFLNRLLSLKLEAQDKVFAAFDAILEENISAAIAAGNLDVGVEQLTADHITFVDQQDVHTDKETGAKTGIVTLEKKNRTFPLTWDEAQPGQKRYGRPVEFIATNKRSGRTYAFAPTRPKTSPNGAIEKQYRRLGPLSENVVSQWDLPRYKVLDVESGEAKKAWEKELENVPEFTTENVNLVVGTLLPIWDRLPNTLMRVFRAKTDDGRVFLGRQIRDSELNETLVKLGAEARRINVPLDDLFTRILKSGDYATLANGWQLRRRIVAGEPRMRLIGPNAFTARSTMMSQGVQFERIAHEGMFFVPDNEAGRKFLTKQLEQSPIVSISGDDDTGFADSQPGYENPRGWENADTKVTSPPREIVDIKNKFSEQAANYKRLSDVDLGMKIAEFLAKHDIDTGTEALIMQEMDEGGSDKIDSVTTSNSHNWVGYPEGLSERLLRGGKNYIAHHNHPSGSSLSSADIMNLAYPAVHWIIAHAKDGRWYGARLSKELADVLHADIGSLPEVTVAAFSKDLARAHRIANDIARSRLQNAINSGAIEVVDAQTYHAHIVNLLAEWAGVIDYQHDIKSVPAKIQNIIDEILDSDYFIYEINRDRYWGDTRPMTEVKAKDAVYRQPPAISFRKGIQGIFDEFRRARTNPPGRTSTPDSTEGPSGSGSLRSEEGQTGPPVGELFSSIDQEELNGLFEEAAPYTDKKTVFNRLRSDLTRVVTFAHEKPSEGVEVIRRKDANDVPIWRRFVSRPEAVFRTYSARLHNVWRRTAELTERQSVWVRQFQNEYSGIVGRLKGVEMEDLTAILFAGDAARVEFTPEELSRGFTLDDEGNKSWIVGEERKPSDAVITSYQKMRRFVSKLGRLVDKHERKMQPRLRTRKFQILKRLARLRQMKEPEFRSLVEEALSARSRLRRSEFSTATGEKQSDLVKEVDRLETEIYGELNPASGEEEGNEFVRLYKELGTIENRLQASSVQRIKGYIPHQFIGSWAVYEVTEEPVVDPNTKEPVLDEDGNPVLEEYFSLIPADKTGFHADMDDAVRAANAYVSENKGASVIVKPVEFKFATYAGTQLTDKSYWRLVGNVIDSMEITGEEARDLVSTVARKRGRRRLASFKNRRKGVDGFSKDLNQVFERHIGQVVRYVTMDEAKYMAISAIEAEGLSPNKTLQERPVLASMVDAWWRDLNGQKQPSEIFIDEWFENRPWSITPTAVAAGTSVFLATGMAGSPLMGALLGSYVGYRFYRAMASGGDFKTRALTGAMLGDMAHLKLGMFFNVFSAGVNLAQTLINTYPVLGGRWTSVGMQRYMAAMSKGRNAHSIDVEKWTQAHRDYAGLARADIRPTAKYQETSQHLFEREGNLAKASLFLFNEAESLNRGTAWIGAYARAESRGASPGQAKREADALVRRTQFNYSNVNKPEILRNVLLRVPLQFKNFMVQELGFISGLRGKEAVRFGIAIVLVAGTLGLPFIDLLDELVKWLFGEENSVIMAVKRRALEAQANGDVPNWMADGLVRGMPSAFGVDISTRVGVGEKFLPLTLRDYLGPWWGTVDGARQLGAENATVIDQIRNLSAGLGGPLKALESAANGMPVIETLFHPGGIDKIADALGDGRLTVTNPWLRGRLEYEPTMAEVIITSLGGTPTRQSKLRDFAQIARVEQQSYQRTARRAIDQSVEALEAGEPERIGDAVREAGERGVPIQPRQIMNAAEQRQTPRGIRAIQTAPRALRPELIELYNAIISPDPTALRDLAESGVTWSREDAIRVTRQAGMPATAGLLEEAQNPTREELLRRFLNRDE